MQQHYYINTELHFGRNILQEIGPYCARYGETALILCQNSASMKSLGLIVKESLEMAGVKASFFHDIQPNPQSSDIDLALTILQKNPPACFIAIGGGSTMDSAKALALRFACQESIPDWSNLFLKYQDFTSLEQDLESNIPIIAVPTTAGTGSHMTQAMVITHEGQKQTLFHHQVKPVVSFMDSMVYEQAPLQLKYVTGFDAFAHAFESYLSPKASIFSRAFSLQALRTILPLLPNLPSNNVRNNDAVSRQGQDTRRNYEHTQTLALMQADTLAGQGLACAGAGLPHPLGEILSSFVPELSHGRSIAIFYPAYLKFLQRYKLDVITSLALEMGYRSPGELESAILLLIEQIGLRQSIESLAPKESSKIKKELGKIMRQISYQDIPIFEVERLISET